MTSIFSLWEETSGLPDQEWLINTFYRQHNPNMFFVATLENQDESWDFNRADALHAAYPDKEINLRVMSDNNTPPEKHENYAWEHTTAEAWILNVKSKLGGRPYRVSFGCEPSFSELRLTNYLAFQVELCKFAPIHEQKISLMGLPGQTLKAFTGHEDDVYNEFTEKPDDPRGKKWIPWLKATHAAGKWVVADYHSYTGPILAAGAYDDQYLPNLVNDRSILDDVDNWYTWNMLYNSPDPWKKWQTRHIFRHRWLNITAEKLGIGQHYYFVGESPHDYYGNEDSLKAVWEQFKNIQGESKPDYVSGINKINKIVEWKFRRPFVEAEVKQLTWFVDMYTNDPYCMGVFFYAATGKAGDQQMYNWMLQLDLLKAMIGKGQMKTFTTDPKPETPPVVIPPEGPKMPEVNAVKVKGIGVRLRKTPEMNAPYELQVSTGVILKVMPDDVAKAYEKIGKPGWWIHVALNSQYTGYISAEFVESVMGAPEKYNWRTEFSERRLKIIDDATHYGEDPFGDVGHELKLTLAQSIAIIEKLNI